MKAALILVPLLGLVLAEQKCEEKDGIRQYQGKPCASTTHYNDGNKGACGCGNPYNNDPFGWNMADFVTAPNQMFFDWGGNSQWCGKKCGTCIKLTPTGGFVPGQGGAPSDLTGHIFMVTNDCPIGANERWCGQTGAPGTGHVNTYGYEAHFDLENNKNQITNGLHWNNPECTWEFVDCPASFKEKYGTCQCAPGFKY